MFTPLFIGRVFNHLMRWTFAWPVVADRAICVRKLTPAFIGRCRSSDEGGFHLRPVTTTKTHSIRGF
jgi:hypothetical protein